MECAVVAIFSVTLPDVVLLLNVMVPVVLFEETKFVEGAVKVGTGKSIAPAGELVTLAVSVAVPINPLTTFSVIIPVADEPCESVELGVRDDAETVKPLTTIVRFPEVAVKLFESVTFTVKLEVPTAPAAGVPEIIPPLDKDSP